MKRDTNSLFITWAIIDAWHRYVLFNVRMGAFINLVVIFTVLYHLLLFEWFMRSWGGVWPLRQVSGHSWPNFGLVWPQKALVSVLDWETTVVQNEFLIDLTKSSSSYTFVLIIIINTTTTTQMSTSLSCLATYYLHTCTKCRKQKRITNTQHTHIFLRYALLS